MSGTSQLRGTSSSYRTLDQRDLASLRPVPPDVSKRARRAATVKPPVVTTGVVCFCGERFSESRALEFMLHLRAEVGEDLTAHHRRRAYDRAYHSDPEYRERRNARRRELRSDPGYRERQNAKARELYARMTPEQKARRVERERKRKQAMRPEERRARLDKRNAARQANPERIARENAATRQRRRNAQNGVVGSHNTGQ